VGFILLMLVHATALCNADQFKCTNGGCIDARKKCDKIYDCPDGSDEHTCNGKDTLLDFPVSLSSVSFPT
jgi:hypothetical protein